MAEQKFKVGDRVKITDFTGTIVGTKLEDNSIKYHVKVDQGRIYTWVFQNALERMNSDADNFKQTITIETERKTGETIIRISNPKFTIRWREMNNRDIINGARMDGDSNDG